MESVKDPALFGGTCGTICNYRLLEVNPKIRDKDEKNRWSIISLGEYMSPLQPKQQLPAGMKRPQTIEPDTEAGLVAALLKMMAPNGMSIAFGRGDS